MQFGSKQNSSCNHGPVTLKAVVNHYVVDNCTDNICTLGTCEVQRYRPTLNSSHALLELKSHHIRESVENINTALECKNINRPN